MDGGVAEGSPLWQLGVVLTARLQSETIAWTRGAIGGQLLDAIYPALVSFALGVVLVRLLAESGIGKRAIDVPNERSLHVKPVPRTGGLGLLGAALAGWALFAAGSNTGLILIAGALSALSFADDLSGLPVSTRFLAQVSAATAFLALYYTGPLLILPLALGALLWMANLYNFMDGSDGLAGGMTVFGFGAYAIAAGEAGAVGLSAMAAAIMGAALGFLVWNWHKAIVFMGDSGSVPLGFLAAGIGIVGWQENAWPFWFPALVFAAFIVDATATLIVRFFRGERLSQPHKTHYYQRALRMGLGHRGTALAAYALMSSMAASALIARDWDGPAVALLVSFWIAVLAALMRVIDVVWRSHPAAQS